MAWLSCDCVLPAVNDKGGAHVHGAVDDQVSGSDQVEFPCGSFLKTFVSYTE